MRSMKTSIFCGVLILTKKHRVTQAVHFSILTVTAKQRLYIAMNALFISLKVQMVQFTVSRHVSHEQTASTRLWLTLTQMARLSSAYHAASTMQIRLQISITSITRDILIFGYLSQLLNHGFLQDEYGIST